MICYKYVILVSIIFLISFPYQAFAKPVDACTSHESAIKVRYDLHALSGKRRKGVDDGVWLAIVRQTLHQLGLRTSTTRRNEVTTLDIELLITASEIPLFESAYNLKGSQLAPFRPMDVSLSLTVGSLADGKSMTAALEEPIRAAAETVETAVGQVLADKLQDLLAVTLDEACKDFLPRPSVAVASTRAAPKPEEPASTPEKQADSAVLPVERIAPPTGAVQAVISLSRMFNGAAVVICGLLLGTALRRVLSFGRPLPTIKQELILNIASAFVAALVLVLVPTYDLTRLAMFPDRVAELLPLGGLMVLAGLGGPWMLLRLRIFWLG